MIDSTFLMSTNSNPHELIITVEGNADAILSSRFLVSAAHQIPNWKFIALKPAMVLLSIIETGE